MAPFGPPIFIFVATSDDATLLLPRDDRVLEHGRSDAVLDAVAGVPLSAADLRVDVDRMRADADAQDATAVRSARLAACVARRRRR